MADALKADGDIKLLANAPKITAKITLPKDVTIDGQGKYTLSANTYFFALAGHNATFRNLTINTTHGVRTDGTAARRFCLRAARSMSPAVCWSTLTKTQP